MTQKPLSGVVVLDLTRYLAGPYCTLLLGGLGAEVIKIEPPGKGDLHRQFPPFGGPQGAAYQPQTADEMGVSYAVLKALHPALILCSISGFGQNGPLREWRAYDPVIQSMSGIASVTGFPDRPPVRCGAAISDTVAPLFAVIGILAAWLAQRTTTEAMALLQQHEVPAGPVHTLPELLTHPHLQARQMVVDLEHPITGPIPGAKGFGMPIRFVEHPVQFAQPAPLLGAHNEEIYGNLLGISAAALGELRAKGVI